MISIIISSHQDGLFENISINISETIGCEYEIIKVDNPGKMSIAEAYNIGINKSAFEILCFCHEDILFHTKNWGPILLHLFTENDIGVLGIAGTKANPFLPIPWWSIDYKKNYSEILQHLDDKRVVKITWGWKQNDSLEEVVITDGLFMSASKSSKLFFDERLKGFHCYDLAFSLNSRNKGFKNFVTNKILLEHKSNGKLDKNWFICMYVFTKIYNKILKQYRFLPQNKDAVESFKNIILQSLKLGEIKISFMYWLKLLKIKNDTKFNLSYIFLFLKAIKKSSFST